MLVVVLDGVEAFDTTNGRRHWRGRGRLQNTIHTLTQLLHDRLLLATSQLLCIKNPVSTDEIPITMSMTVVSESQIAVRTLPTALKTAKLSLAASVSPQDP